MSTTAHERAGSHGHRPWSVRRWILVNSTGLGVAFGLFALFGGTVEALGAEHDSVVRDLSLLVAFAIGGGLWAHLRHRTLLSEVTRAGRVAVVAMLALAGGFLAGFLFAGPPLDFVLSILALGAVAGSVEWRILRRHLPRPRRLAVAGSAGWLVASVAAIVPVALLGDAIDGALGGGVAPFVVNLTLIGMAGGATGGALEALALRNRVRALSAEQPHPATAS